MPRMKFVCPWCGRGSVACPTKGECISDAEKAELIQFVRDNGVQWRSVLRNQWGGGSIVLRQVRNIVGPSQLSKVHPPLDRFKSSVGMDSLTAAIASGR